MSVYAMRGFGSIAPVSMGASVPPVQMGQPTTSEAMEVKALLYNAPVAVVQRQAGQPTAAVEEAPPSVNSALPPILRGRTTNKSTAPMAPSDVDSGIEQEIAEVDQSQSPSAPGAPGNYMTGQALSNGSGGGLFGFTWRQIAFYAALGLGAVVLLRILF